MLLWRPPMAFWVFWAREPAARFSLRDNDPGLAFICLICSGGCWLHMEMSLTRAGDTFHRRVRLAFVCTRHRINEGLCRRAFQSAFIFRTSVRFTENRSTAHIRGQGSGVSDGRSWTCRLCRIVTTVQTRQRHLRWFGHSLMSRSFLRGEIKRFSCFDVFFCLSLNAASYFDQFQPE